MDGQGPQEADDGTGVPAGSGQTLSTSRNACARCRRPPGLLDQKQLEAVGAFCSPSRRCFTAPVTGTFHAVFTQLPPDTPEDALGLQEARNNASGMPPAVDGRRFGVPRSRPREEVG